MRILVTGAGGFTGKALTELLTALSGNQLFVHRRNAGADVATLGHDLYHLPSCLTLLRETNPDQIYNLCGSFSNDFQTDYQNNVLITSNLLEAMVRLGLKARCLLIGSAAEYGLIKENENPVNESRPLKPVSIYGLTKVMQTQLMEYYLRKFNLDLVMARTFNLIGDNMSDKLFFGALQKKIKDFLAGRNPAIELGNLDSSRDYLEVAKAVKHYETIMKYGTSGNCYNVGAGFPTAVRQILLNELQKYGLDISCVKQVNRAVFGKEDVDVIYADISKLLSLQQ